MSNENNIAKTPPPVSEPNKPYSGMTRIRFFKIIANQADQYDAILGAYKQAPQMPAIQIPRVAVSIGDKVQTAEMEVPSSQVKTERRLDVLVDEFGNEYKSLKDSTEVVIVSQLPPSQQPAEVAASYLSQSLPTSSNSNDLTNSPFMQKPADFEKAA